MIDRKELESLSREALVDRARRLEIERPEVMTRVELADEIVRRTITDEVARRRARGWLGVARDLVAELIEQGLHLPDAAALVRRTSLAPTVIRHQPPVATVTLSEIYAAQGHHKRALSMLDEVLKKEPDHEIARSLRNRLAKEKDAPRTQRSLGDAPSSASATSSANATDSASATDATAGDATPASDAVPTTRFDDATPMSDAVPTTRFDDAVAPTNLADAVAPTEAAPATELHTSGPATEAAVATPKDAAPKDAAPKDADHVALLSDATGALTIVWALRPETVSLASRKDRDGRPVLRIACMVPNHAGAEKHERDVELDRAEGSARVSDLPERSVLRGALGYRDPRGFRPLALATELARREGGLRVVWSPRATQRDPALEQTVTRLCPQ